MIYDSLVYEQRLFYFNTERRQQPFDHGVHWGFLTAREEKEMEEDEEGDCGDDLDCRNLSQIERSRLGLSLE